MYYETGKPCKRGHVSPRYISTRQCKSCMDERQKSEEVLAYDRLRYAKDPEGRQAHTKKWRAANKPRARMLSVKRRASKLQATPPWLNKGHLFEMECIYAYAAALNEIGIKSHVDHIIPLQGKLVRGQHVPWNLQVLPAKDNMSKGNR